MNTMRAARFDPATRRLTVQDVPTPSPAPGQALVKVAACGICHSDLSLLNGIFRTELPTITPGHEAAGTVARLGGPTPGWEVGDRVVLHAGRACRTCAACVSGAALDDCERIEIMAFDFDGAWAEYVLVPVSTPYAAVVDTAAVRPAETVGVWGLGGIGTHAVQTARMAGAAPVIALDPLPAARQRALELGADHAVDPTADDALDQIARLTGGRGLDVAIDAVGRGISVTQAGRALGHRGRLVMVGMSQDRIELGPITPF
ncbi:zinc-binding dehydrogenase, partial [Streptomyces hygroscopicus]|uniref:alcohol dehydrogenase catalytic domain-containing protein n=1 Tax=Streptomyces hygroscopicus TaxID=1912 RepID=UPI00223EB3D3